MEKIFDPNDVNFDQELLDELLRVVFSSASGYKYILKVLDNDFEIVAMNHLYQECFGVTEQAVCGKTPRDLFDWITAENFYKHYRECVNCRKATTYRETIQLPSGEKHFTTFLSPVIQSDRVTYIVGEKIDSTSYLTELKKNQEYEKEISGQISLSRSLFQISMGFTKTNYNDFEKQVDSSLSLLGGILHCDLINIFKFFKDEEYARRIKRWSKNGGNHNIDTYDFSDEEFTSVIQNKKGSVPNINNHSVNDFVRLYQKGGESDREEATIKSVISIPVVYDDEIWGYITYYHVNENKEWNEHEIEALMLFGDIFINTFFRVEAERQLRILSEKDDLTGLDNRLSLMNHLAGFDDMQYLPFGFIFMDVNGLKMTNDCFGHVVGDNLLITAAEILKDVAGDSHPARMGGDEFALLCPNTKEEDILEILKKIKDQCQSTENLPIPLSISIGYAVRNSLELSMSELFERAEINMYRQKAQESKAVKNEIMEYFMRKMESGKNFSPEHHQTVISLAIKLGNRLALREIEMEKLNKALVFYHIGDVPLSEEVTKRASSYIQDGAKYTQSHSETGYYIAMAMPFLQPVAEIILSHHENWDGTGYPQGLKGQEIPFISRIIALVDAYVTMTQPKDEQPARSKKEAIRELETQVGRLFDPRVVKEFLEVLKDEN